MKILSGTTCMLNPGTLAFRAILRSVRNCRTGWWKGQSGVWMRQSSALPLSIAGPSAVIDQFDSDIVTLQLGYAFALVR